MVADEETRRKRFDEQKKRMQQEEEQRRSQWVQTEKNLSREDERLNLYLTGK